jgi:hypothetical protein
MTTETDTLKNNMAVNKQNKSSYKMRKCIIKLKCLLDVSRNQSFKVSRNQDLEVSGFKGIEVLRN